MDRKTEIDLYKPFVDEIVLLSDSGKPMRRIPDLIDVWFDSGAMPYAQMAFPLKTRRPSARVFRLISLLKGGPDPGLVLYAHALAAMLFDSVAYKTCVSNGLVLDKNGNKMSKRLGNVVDPFPDHRAIWRRCHPLVPRYQCFPLGERNLISKSGKYSGNSSVPCTIPPVFCPLCQCRWLRLPGKLCSGSGASQIDRWILSSLHSLVKRVNEYMDDYEPTQAGRAIEDFVDEHLSNFRYVRLCRRRFWKGDYGHDKLCAYQTLYECLETVIRLIAPISPFFSDSVFRNLEAVTGRIGQESVHHARFPESDPAVIDRLLEERMQLAQDASSPDSVLRKRSTSKCGSRCKSADPGTQPGYTAAAGPVEDLIKAK